MAKSEKQNAKRVVLVFFVLLCSSEVQFCQKPTEMPRGNDSERLHGALVGSARCGLPGTALWWVGFGFGLVGFGWCMGWVCLGGVYMFLLGYVGFGYVRFGLAGFGLGWVCFLVGLGFSKALD